MIDESQCTFSNRGQTLCGSKIAAFTIQAQTSRSYSDPSRLIVWLKIVINIRKSTSIAFNDMKMKQQNKKLIPTKRHLDVQIKVLIQRSFDVRLMLLLED